MSITEVPGFRACGITAGFKASGKSDLALVVNDGPEQIAAGVFTSNRVFAAPVGLCYKHLHDGLARAIILNSGCANACTGRVGDAAALRTAELVASQLNCQVGDVLVCSTGMIGVQLPMDVMENAIPQAVAALDSSPEAGHDAAQAIMTTDSVPKETKQDGPGYSIAGMAKGAGMLAPGLATMLVVLVTDAVLTPEVAHAALSQASHYTFNRIDSDGCMSTNDTVLLLASGASGVRPDAADFSRLLKTACNDLAYQLINDAEGASHNIKVTVNDASSEAAAEAAARAITRSNLFKTAIFGNDPNWGRILAALGTVPAKIAPFDAKNIDLAINGVMVAKASEVGEDRNLVDMAKSRDVHIDVYLNAGSSSATIWTNDLTNEYVHENSAYST